VIKFQPKVVIILAASTTQLHNFTSPGKMMGHGTFILIKIPFLVGLYFFFAHDVIQTIRLPSSPPSVHSQVAEHHCQRQLGRWGRRSSSGLTFSSGAREVGQSIAGGVEGYFPEVYLDKG